MKKLISNPTRLLASIRLPGFPQKMVLACAGVLLVQSARATLYLLEPFDYPPGPLTNAIPWSTNGTAVESIPTQSIVAGDLAYPPLDQPVTVNSACLQWSSNVKGERAIPGGPYGGPGSGQSIYCSFMFVKTTANEDAANLPIVGIVNDNVGTLNSANTTIGGAVLNITSAVGSGGLYQLGIKVGGGVSGAIYPPSGQTYVSGNTNGTFGQTNLVVMKYTFSSAGSDTVALWVNPASSSFGGSEPAATANDVAATNSSGFTAGAASGLGYFQIRGGSGTQAGVLQIDNVRIGSTWADVTPTCVTAGITSDPHDYPVSPGQTATFSLAATGQRPAYQWQTNKNNAGWLNIAGATNASYTTVPEVLGDNGLQFRGIVNVACDNSSVTSHVATLTVTNCVTAATTDPTNLTVGAGFSGTFAISPTGTAPTFQWQTNNNSGWLNIGKATNASYTTPPEILANNGLQFRCIVSVGCNSSSATSALATLTVVCNTAQVTGNQNPNPVVVVAGQSATFSVSSTSSNPTYQWATDNGTGGATFTDIPNATNTSYTTPPTVVGQYGWQYRCTVSNACDMTIASATEILEVNCFPAQIGSDIANTSVSLGAGQTASFSVGAGTTSLPTYQWQTNNGGGWVNIALATNASYTTAPLPIAYNGLQYQCFVTAPCDGSTATSSVATVSVYTDNAEFLSLGNGNLGDVTTWEQSFDGGNSFNNPALYPPVDINSTNTVIQNGHTVTCAASAPLNHVIVQSGGQLTVATNKTITLTTNGAATATALDVSGIVDITGTVSINTNVQAVVESGGVWELEPGGNTSGSGKLIFNSGAVYKHNYATTAGTIPTATWNTGSSCQVVGVTTATTTLGGVAQTFYNFIWNCPSQSSALPWGGSVPTNNGDFTFISTGTGETRISNNNSPTMKVSGNFNMQGGQLTFASGTGKPVIALSGDAVLSGGKLSNSLNSAGATVNFVKAGVQSYANSGTTIIGPINWLVNSNSTLLPSGVISSNLTLATGGQIRLITNSGFQVKGNLTNNNNTVVADLGGATLGNGTYALMTYLGSLSGYPNSTPTIVNGSVTGVAFISTATANQVNLVVAPASTPVISSFGIAGTALNLTTTNGIPGDSYAVLASTNVALPLAQWTPIVPHAIFDGAGNANTSIQLTNTLGTNAVQQFFRIRMPGP